MPVRNGDGTLSKSSSTLTGSAIYRPLLTELVREASARGCRG